MVGTSNQSVPEMTSEIMECHGDRTFQPPEKPGKTQPELGLHVVYLTTYEIQ